MTEVHVVLPNDIDDPATPSGGNAYDRQVCRGLAASGWAVREHAVAGAWPEPSAQQRSQLGRVLKRLPDDAVVLLDGLVASAVPEVLVPEAQRLRLVVLVHMPLGDLGRAQPEPGLGGGEHTPRYAAEGEALAAARAVVTTSEWTKARLLDRYRLPADRVHVAAPGVDPAPLAPGSDTGGHLLCVAAVTPHKGHDVLVEALAKVADLPWSCACAGTLSRDPAFVDRLSRQLDGYGLADRVRLVGPRTGGALDAAYAGADLLVLASRGETYGMVVTEALARGIPVLATAVGGLPEALGRAPDGTAPGILVEPDDPAALAAELRRWLTEPERRHRLRRSARARRTTLTGWAVTSEIIAETLIEASA